MTLDELAVAMSSALAKMAERDKSKPIATMLAQWTWEMSFRFKTPILVMLVPGGLVSIPLPTAPAAVLNDPPPEQSGGAGKDGNG